MRRPNTQETPSAAPAARPSAARVPIDTQAGKSPVPPFIRRFVMERDGHRCQAPGCTHTRYLGVYHLDRVPGRDRNHPANLVTLCTVCHQLWNIMGRGPLMTAQASQGN